MSGLESQAKGFWDRVRRDWDNQWLTTAKVARRNEVPLEDMLVHAAANKWEPRPTSLDLQILVRQILGVLEVQIEHLEKTEMTASGEKEAAVLGKLTGHLDKLINLVKAEAHGSESEVETAEMREIRNKLAERINALTKG